MNSTADQTNSQSLNSDSLNDFYKEACSLSYLAGADDEKETIYCQLKERGQRYWIVRQLNKGGVKKILEAKDGSTDRSVAMAVLHNCENSHHVENFLREARITAMLQHPNIMPVYDIGLNSLDKPFFTMKLVKKGYNLQKLIDSLKFGRQKKYYLQLNDRLELFLKICDAVAYAHSLGIIHLDLKPENIQLDDFGQVLVCDWGLARFTGKKSGDEAVNPSKTVTSLDFINLTLNGVIKGTPGYMAPEQATLEQTEKDHRTDIYSLGALIYTLLSFEMPIARNELKTMLNDTTSGKIRPLNIWRRKHIIPETLEKITLRAMETDPDRRYQSVEEIQDDIRAYLNGFVTSVEEAGFFKLLKLFYQRNKLKCNLIAAATAVIITITSYMVWELKKSEALARENARIAEKNAKLAQESAEIAEESENRLIESIKQLNLEKEEKNRFAKISALVTMQEASKLNNQQMYLKGYHKLKEAVEYLPDNWRAWYRLGCFEFTRQNFSKAEGLYTKSLNLAREAEESEKTVIKNMKNLAHEFKEKIDQHTGRLTKEDLNRLSKKLNILGYGHLTYELLHRTSKNLFYRDKKYNAPY